MGEFAPKSGTRLLTHMRKIVERAKRRKAGEKQDGDNGGGDDFEGMMKEDKEDSENGKSFRTNSISFTKMTLPDPLQTNSDSQEPTPSAMSTHENSVTSYSFQL